MSGTELPACRRDPPTAVNISRCSARVSLLLASTHVKCLRIHSVGYEDSSFFHTPLSLLLIDLTWTELILAEREIVFIVLVFHAYSVFKDETFELVISLITLFKLENQAYCL